jgi:hypothetical protein
MLSTFRQRGDLRRRLGLWRSLVAHLVRIEGVWGSNPHSSTKQKRWSRVTAEASVVTLDLYMSDFGSGVGVDLAVISRGYPC